MNGPVLVTSEILNDLTDSLHRMLSYYGEEVFFFCMSKAVLVRSEELGSGQKTSHTELLKIIDSFVAANASSASSCVATALGVSKINSK